MTASAPQAPAPPAIREPAWTLDIGVETWGAPLAVGTMLVVGSDDGGVRAIDMGARTVAWRFDTAGPVRAGAATDGDALYINSDDGSLYSLGLDGTLRWSARIGKDEAGPVQTVPTEPVPERGVWDPYSPTPVVDGGVAYVGTHDGWVTAVDTRDGSVVWRFNAGGAVYGAAAVDAQRVYAASMAGKAVALDRATGAPVWEFAMGESGACGPLVMGGRVFVGSRATDLYALDAATGSQLWQASFGISWVESRGTPIGDDAFAIGSSDMQQVQAFRASTGEVLWSVRVPGYPWAVPAVGDGVVYQTWVSIETQKPWEIAVCAIDAATGAMLWAADAGDALAYHPWDHTAHGAGAAPTLIGDLLVVAGLDGVLRAYAA